MSLTLRISCGASRFVVRLAPGASIYALKEAIVDAHAKLHPEQRRLTPHFTLRNAAGSELPDDTLASKLLGSGELLTIDNPPDAPTEPRAAQERPASPPSPVSPTSAMAGRRKGSPPRTVKFPAEEQLVAQPKSYIFAEEEP